MDKSYVVVVNKNGIISPVRHVVSIYEPYDEEDFKKWYYTDYKELEGDVFIHCPTRKERDCLLDALKK